MGLPITREYGAEKTILKFFPYEAAACVVPESMATAADKIVPAGTPFPSNDGNCKGYLLHNVDVSRGDADGVYVYQGTINTEKLTELGVSVSDAAKAATPRVTFYE